MPPRTEKLAIMFTEICGCDALYERCGEEIARRLTANCIFLLLEQLAAKQGTLIKTIGDGIVASFDSVTNAMDAACAMQHAIANSNAESEYPTHIRVGFHYGEVTFDADDISGDTVKLAARVASITRAAQIMTTLAVVVELAPELRGKMHPVMRTTLEGKPEQFDIFRVEWKPDEAPLPRVGTAALRKPVEDGDELELRYRDQTVKVGEQRKSIVLGREAGCDLLVVNKSTSRRHASIELRLGKFIIVDQSTNGTFIRFSDGRSIRLSHRELVLQGSGLIILGQPFSENLPDVVQFSVGSAQA